MPRYSNIKSYDALDGREVTMDSKLRGKRDYNHHLDTRVAAAWSKVRGLFKKAKVYEERRH